MAPTPGTAEAPYAVPDTALQGPVSVRPFLLTDLLNDAIIFA
jgi:hypothetical protein